MKHSPSQMYSVPLGPPFPGPIKYAVSSDSIDDDTERGKFHLKRLIQIRAYRVEIAKEVSDSSYFHSVAPRVNLVIHLLPGL